jgi:hypothetical protein
MGDPAEPEREPRMLINRPGDIEDVLAGEETVSL